MEFSHLTSKVKPEEVIFFLLVLVMLFYVSVIQPEQATQFLQCYKTLLTSMFCSAANYM